MESGGGAFPVTAIMGSVGSISGVQLTPRGGGAPMTADIVLVARRSADRCGTRHWRRGADTLVRVGAGRGAWLLDDHPAGILATHCAMLVIRCECIWTWDPAPGCSACCAVSTLTEPDVAAVLCPAPPLLQGAVANFVETEQVVTIDGGRLLASYVQVGRAPWCVSGV